jgi:hypothetical protein
LLTTQGEELVDAASDAFRSLGFIVTIPEEEATAAKAEDLLLSRHDWQSWQASVEVKGFATSSAKIPHAIKLDQRRRRRGSVQALLVVNGEFSTPPPLRHSPFQGNRESHDSLVELATLVIDSRDLYKAVVSAELASQLVDAIHHGAGVFPDRNDAGSKSR